MGRVRNGSRVRVTSNGNGSANQVGDEGIVNDYCGDSGSEGGFRVQVKGRKPSGNWHTIQEVEVLEY